MLSIGTAAPDFSLFNQDKKEITLSSFRGKNVLIHFFPLSFTGVCTEQLCHSRDHLQDYKNMDAVVLAISTDSIFSQAAFRQQLNLDFDLLSDYNHEVINAWGMEIAEFAFGMKGVSARGTYIIDKEGVVRYAERTANPGVLPDFQAIQACLSGLK
jgi:peroxiredoxin